MANLRSDQIQLIWNQYKDEQDWQRHSESQRAMFSQFLLAITAALLAIFPKTPQAGDWVIPIFIISIGAFGILVVLKYRERYLVHVAVAAEYRKVIDGFFGEEESAQNLQNNLFIETLEKALDGHSKKTSFLFKANYFRQHSLWVGLFTLIIYLGIVLFRMIPV